jgi:hypothetical protein
VVPLYGPWQFTVGDSPLDLQTGQPLWAEPDFDDSKWEKVDLTPEIGSFDPITGTMGYVSGWTARGHAGYWGYAWYWIRVPLQAKPGTMLALAGPDNTDDVYQFFDNGKLAGSFGNFSSSNPVVYSIQPMMFPLPQPLNRGAGDSPGSLTQVLAFRVWMEPSTLMTSPDVGGFHTAPVIGEAAAVTADYRLRWLELVRSYASRVVEALLFGLLAVVAFSLILFDRSDRVYPLMGALFLLTATLNANIAVSACTQHMSAFTELLLREGLLIPLMYAGWVMVWWVWFGRQRLAWYPRAVAWLTLLYMVSNTLGEELFLRLVPHPVSAAFQIASIIVRLLFFALLAWIIVLSIQRQGLEGWLVLPPILLWGIGAFATEITFLHIWIRWHPFRATFILPQLASLLLVVVIALLLLRRLLLSVRRQRLMALDVKQAQEVQQMILPEACVVLVGLTVESEYRPAREVGGDFFQIIPNMTNECLLVVAGDVTGKGLKAGMLVAPLVGAIRTAAEASDQPEAVLGTLNRRLLGRGDAQATCLALRIEKDGAVTLANAGHMAPYLNGEPLPMEGALPLGMIENPDFSSMQFQLNTSDKLILISDGIPEATDADGRLFGFERVHELLRKAGTAAELATVAQSFGQEDDISVISVTRIAKMTPAAA